MKNLVTDNSRLITVPISKEFAEKNNLLSIQFNPKTAIPVREPFLNSYGFDLTNENTIGYITGKLKFTIMGFRATTQYDTLIATVKVSLNPHVQDAYTHIQKIDLYNHDRVNTYCRTSAFQLKINEDEVKKGIYSLRERLERYRLDELKLGGNAEKKVSITPAEQKEAIEILKADNLMDCMEGLLKDAGLITEKENGLRLFFILLSRHFDKPLHVLFQGSPQLSRMITDTITSTIPVDEIHTQTSMSAGSLYYTKQKKYWKNKVLSIGSIDKQFKGASTIKEFIENQTLKRYTTESDYLTRQLHSNTKTVEGNVCLLGFSEDETMNNKFFQECFFIRIDENEKNKSEMLNHLKMQSGGFVDVQKQTEAIRCLMNIQSLITPKNVVIPYAMELDISQQVFQPLRSFNQLLTLIKTVALLHQHQLKTKKNKNGTEYIEATPEHLEIAIELFKSIMVTQSDILSPSTRSFFERLKTQVKEKELTFKIPEMMKTLQMKRTPFYREFEVIKELKYVVQSGGNKKKGIDYKITNWDDYTELQAGTNLLEAQLKKIKNEVSHKIPTSFPKLKKLGNEGIISLTG